MHFIKRAAFRALAAPSSSIIRSSVPSSTPFAIRNQAAVVSAFKRFNSTENKPEGIVEQAKEKIEQATEKIQEFASEAKEAVQEKAAAWNDAPAPRERGFASPPRYKAEPSRAIYVGNLLFEATPEQLQETFSPYGEIESTRIAQDARGLSKGFGYVTFKDIDSAAKAIEALNNTVFAGRRMIVNYMTNTSQNRAQNAPTKTLFIGNLAFEMTDADLNKLFRDIKNVIDVRVAIDRRTGQPRGFAHADFTDVASAEEAMKQLQGKAVYDRSLRVDFSASSKPAFGGRREGGERGERGERQERAPRQQREDSW